MICCRVENPKSDVLKCHLPRLYDYLWIAEDGMKTKVHPSKCPSLIFLCFQEKHADLCSKDRH
jgi:hypothetical protein